MTITFSLTLLRKLWLQMGFQAHATYSFRHNTPAFIIKISHFIIYTYVYNVFSFCARRELHFKLKLSSLYLRPLPRVLKRYVTSCVEVVPVRDKPKLLRGGACVVVWRGIILLQLNIRRETPASTKSRPHC